MIDKLGYGMGIPLGITLRIEFSKTVVRTVILHHILCARISDANLKHSVNDAHRKRIVIECGTECKSVEIEKRLAGIADRRNVHTKQLLLFW